MCVCLFRYCLVCEGHGDHRDLHVLTHSFPTRRSSDLHSVRKKFTEYGLPIGQNAWAITMGALDQYRTNTTIWKVDTLEDWLLKVEEDEAHKIASINQSNYKSTTITITMSTANISAPVPTTHVASTTKEQPIEKPTYCSQYGKASQKGIKCRTKPIPNPQ